MVVCVLMVRVNECHVYDKNVQYMHVCDQRLMLIYIHAPCILFVFVVHSESGRFFSAFISFSSCKHSIKQMLQEDKPTITSATISASPSANTNNLMHKHSSANTNKRSQQYSRLLLYDVIYSVEECYLTSTKSKSVACAKKSG